MKISAGGSIPLDGPLSRNSRILALKPGDTVKVQVLEWLSPSSAILDIKGNKVQASFSAPVPQSPQLNLLLKSFSPKALQFELKGDAPQDIKNYLATLTGLDIKDLSPDKLRDIILTARKAPTGIFTIMLRLTGYSDVRAKSIIRLAEKLQAKGELRGSFSFVSGLLSGMTKNESEFIFKLLSPFLERGMSAMDPSGSLIDDIGGYPSGAASENFADFFSENSDSGASLQCGCMVFPVSDGFASVKTVCREGVYAGTVETPFAGTFEFLIRGGSENCNVVISCGDEAFTLLSGHARDLFDALSLRYKKTALSVISSAEIHEKILAFAVSSSHNTFNVKV